MENLEEIGDYIAAQKLELAAKNIQHLLKVQQEQASLDNIAASLKQSIIDAHGNDPTDLCDMMVTQARMMDVLFQYYLDDAHGKYTQHEKITSAMKAQGQSVRTALAWKRLKSETEIKRKIIRYFVPEEKNTQNELNKSKGAGHATLDSGIPS